MQIFWLNPLAWAFRAAVLNEFQAPEYVSAASCIVDVAEGAPCPQDKTLGQVPCYNSVRGGDGGGGGVVLLPDEEKDPLHNYVFRRDIHCCVTFVRVDLVAET